jgi:hypothetical protein
MSPIRLFSALLTGLLITAAATGCRKTVHHTSTVSTVPDTLIAGTVIKSAGSWTARTPKGSTKLDLTVSGTSVNWSITTEEKIGRFGSSSGSSGSGMGLSSPSDSWFVFVEAPSKLWFFNGKDELTYKLLHANGGSQDGKAIISGELHSSSPPAPSELVLLLPPDLRKLFPHVSPSGKRPSL